MPRGRSNKNGVSLKVTGDIVSRLSGIRALWLAIQNDPDLSVQDAAVEFFYAVGALLEGRALSQIELRKLNRGRVSQHFKEG